MCRGDPDNNFVKLVEAVEHGDQDAIRALWHRCYGTLVRTIRAWYGNRSRPVTDEEDLAAEVLTSLIEQVQRGACRAIVREHDFQALAWVTARHRFITQRRFESRDKRGAGVSGFQLGFDVTSRDGGPDDDASELEEEILSLLSIPYDNKLWAILIQLFLGHSKPQTARKLHMSRRSLDRLLKDLRGRWKKHINGEHVPKRVETWAEFVKLLASRGRTVPPPPPASCGQTNE